ncbi:MAG TPA: hypothetical protein VMZ90_00155 [Vicinamibacterales bacterium]|nr:hypothetical protein [Vicinamibacterales bacterium]
MDTTMWVILAGALALALGMAVVAWRLLRSDRERTDARAEMLRQLAFEPEPALNERAFQAPIVSSFEPSFGATVDRENPPTRRLMAVAVIIVFMAIGAGSVYGIYKPGSSDASLSRGSSEGETGLPGRSAEGESSLPRRSSEGETSLPRRSSEGAKAGAPLELLSLSHRTESGDFVVAGLVQNPSDGRPAASVMAVVYLFNAQGDYFSSGKASLEFAPLAPGAESPFVVRIPKTAGVSRFRVGFRAQDGSVVAHVDRRGQPIGGTTGGATPNRSSHSGGL